MNRLHTRVAAAALATVIAFAGVGCSGGKPTKEEYRAGYAKIMKDNAGSGQLPQDMMDKILDCMVDKTYDKLSDSTVQAIAKGDKNATTKVTEADQKIIMDAGMECGKEVTPK